MGISPCEGHQAKEMGIYPCEGHQARGTGIYPCEGHQGRGTGIYPCEGHQARETGIYPTHVKAIKPEKASELPAASCMQAGHTYAVRFCLGLPEAALLNAAAAMFERVGQRLLT